MKLHTQLSCGLQESYPIKNAPLHRKSCTLPVVDASKSLFEGVHDVKRLHTVVVIGVDYVVWRLRYCDDFVMVFVCLFVCVCLWVCLWVCVCGCC